MLTSPSRLTSVPNSSNSRPAAGRVDLWLLVCQSCAGSKSSTGWEVRAAKYIGHKGSMS